jgi:hypothetical protein
MSQPTTHPETTRTEPEAARPGPNWSPRRAWRLRALWGPAARALAAAAAAGGEVRVLAVGPRADALEAMLARAAVATRFTVRAAEPAPDGALGFDDGAFDWVVAVDYLPLVRPSQRERAVRELCRVARAGVIVAGPFHSEEVAAAERAVNALYAASTGEDHPELGRHIEYGLPDLDAVRAWARSAFPHVAAEPGEPLTAWQGLASVAVFESRGEAATASDAAAAALLPPSASASDEPPYRTMLVASASPVPSAPPAPRGDDATALATHMAMEAAAQRRALDRLTDAVTATRDREREEFRATVASIAAELHEREAQAEVMGADLRERERVIADQTAYIEAMERRIEETDIHVGNLERERDATNVHVRNLEAERELLRAKVRELERDADETRRQLGEARRSADSLEGELEQTRRHAGHLEAALRDTSETHRRLLDSPGGRALTSYVRLKRRILRRS